MKYPGGKYRLRKTIVGKMPPHKTYVEPFAGAANVMLAKPPSEKEVLADKNPNIVRVHRAIKQKGAWWDMSPSRRRWEEIKAKPPSQRSAEETVFLIERSYGGKGKNYVSAGGNKGSFETDKLHGRLKDVTMVSDDFANVMRRWDSEKTLHYLDPPYDATTKDWYEPLGRREPAS